MTPIGSLIAQGADGAASHEPALVEWSSVEQRVTRRTSFSELAFLAEQMEAALRRHGVQPGDSVAILSHPTLDFFIAVSGMLRLGAVAVIINWRQPLETMKYMAALGRSKRVISSAHFLASGVAERLLPDTGSVLLLGNASSLSDALASSIANKNAVPLLAKPSHADRCDDASDNTSHDGQLGHGDIACVMFTSGSTGQPKGVPLTHQGLLWSCEAKLKAHGGRARVARGTLSFLPNFHVMGFTNNFIFNVCVARCPSYVHRECETVPLSLEVMSSACISLQPSLVDTIPHFLEALALQSTSNDEHFAETIRALAACERVLFGGCALSSKALEVLPELGLKLASQYGQTYGQTELNRGMVLLGVPSSEGGRRSEMKPVPGCEWRLDHDELVLLNCPAACAFYLDPTPGAVTSTDTPLDTPKPAHFTKDLYDCRDGVWLTHRCRTDDLIVHSSGEMTNPLPLEDALLRSLGSAVVRACVVGQQRPCPVALLQLPHSKDDVSSLSPSKALLSAAVKAANDGAPQWSKLQTARILLVKEELPVSSKGNVIRARAEEMHCKALDALDLALLLGDENNDDVDESEKGARNDRTTTCSASASASLSSRVARFLRGGPDASEDDGEDEDDEDEALDSITATRRGHQRASARECAYRHVLAIAMFSVLQAHSLWPRRSFWLNHLGQTHPVLSQLHTPLELLCMPAFATIAGLRDFGKSSSGHQNNTNKPRALIVSALRVTAAHVVLSQASRGVAAVYMWHGTDCSGEAMQKVLWFLPFLATCRFLRGITSLLRLKNTHVAAAAALLHVGVWNYGSLGEPYGTLDHLLDHCKVRNYGVFYWSLAPLLHGFGIPSTQPRFDSRRRKCRVLAVVLALTVSGIRPQWFAQDYQFLSEARHQEPLHVHLQQLLAASLVVAASLEGASRKPSPLSRTLGAGTFSCFVLHWWLRPMWLSNLATLLKFAAPFLGSGDSSSSSSNTSLSGLLGAVVIAIVYSSYLLSVQWSLSGVTFTPTNASIRASRNCLLFVIGWCFLGWTASHHGTGNNPYLNRCAAFVPHKPRTAPIDHHWSFSFSSLTASSNPSASNNTKPSLCLVSDHKAFAKGTCERLSSKKKLSKDSATDVRDALPCLNRVHACEHGYSYLSANMPFLNLLRGQPPFDLNHNLDALAHACSDQGAILHEADISYAPSLGHRHEQLRSHKWCKVLLLDRAMTLFPNQCADGAVFVDAGSRLGSNSALHTHPDVASFLNSKNKLLLVSLAPKSHRSTATAVAKRSNRHNVTTAALGSSFLMARNNRKGRHLVREWWTSVDFHGDLPVPSSSTNKAPAKDRPVTRPLRFFRVGGYQEQSVLSTFIARRYPKSIQVLSGEGAYQSMKSKQPWTLVNGLSKELAEKYNHPCNSSSQAKTTPTPIKSEAAVEAEGNSSSSSASRECTETLHLKFNATCSECVVDKRGGSCPTCIRLGFMCDCTCGATGALNKAFSMKFPTTRGSMSTTKRSASRTHKATS